MDDLLPLLGVAAPVVLVLLAAFGWVVGGRRRGPSTPAPLDGAPVVVARAEHDRRVEAAEAAHAETEAEVAGRAPEERGPAAVASWQQRER